MPDKRASRKRQYPRLRAIPPALRSAGEPFEGYFLLCEDPGEAGVVFWQALRDTTLWADTSREQRQDLFSPTAADRARRAVMDATMNESVRPYLLIIIDLLHGSTPAAGSEVAATCRKLAGWAEEQSRPQTAIAFAQAAALAWPESAECAHKVGWLTRRHGEYARAESWFRRSIAVSRRFRDIRSRALSWIGLGNLYILRGDHPAAEKVFRRALRAASRAGLSDLKAMALHDLFALAVETHRTADAEAYAQKAVRAFGSTHPRLPGLAHDIAGFWLSLGSHARALTVFRAVLSVTKRSSERLLVLASVGWAAGGAGQRGEFLDAWVEAWRIIDAHSSMECVATSALRLAYGASLLEDWERAELAAGYASRLARERHEREVLTRAQALLGEIQERRIPQTAPAAAADDSAIAMVADNLADGLVRRLGVYAGVVRNRPRIPCNPIGSAARSVGVDPLRRG